ncbi:MAG TPA: ADOP family duplicated permease, partial [Longimicrobiaceae bacterium]
SREMTVVGIAPAGFGGILAGLPVDVWVPEAAYRRGAPAAEEAGRTSWLVMVGRLRPGVSREQARAALEVIAKRVPPEQEGTTIRGVRVDAHSGVPAERREMLAGFLGMLLATAGLVLLIACTNVAGMGVARAVARRRETAIRLAIGAGRARLVRQLVTETVLLFLVGGAAGLLLALWLSEMLSAFRPPVPVQVAFDLGVDWRVFGFAMALALGTGVIFGLVPALGASRPDLVPALKEGREAPGRRGRLRSGFVVAQLAMSLLLLVTAGLFVRTLRSALAEEPGFDPDGVVVAQLGLSAHGYDAARSAELYGRLRERLEADPGVRSVAAARFAPMSGNVMATTIEPQDVRPGARGEPVPVGVDPVGPGYFETLRIPVLAGRAFTARDAPGTAPVAVVNQALAARLWPGESPIGRRVRVNGTVREVVGVARNAKYEGHRDEREAHLYLPLAQNGSANLTVIVRSRGGAAGGLEAIRRELRALDPDVALREASPLPALVGLSLFPQRLAAGFIGVFGAVGLLLAAVGLYGILAHGVAQRRREIGVRIALGARAGDVLRMVVRSGLALTAVGIAVGLAAALALTRLLSGMLYGVTATDPVTFAAVPLLLLGVALLASYLPARRATRVDPMVALRAD